MPVQRVSRHQPSGGRFSLSCGERIAWGILGGLVVACLLGCVAMLVMATVFHWQLQQSQPAACQQWQPAGWRDPIGGFLRAFAPAIIVILAEATRALLLRRNEDVQQERERKADERIPRIRWVLAPWPTFVLWRRMKLWDIRDYRAAVDMELSRRHAIVKLGERYGKAWQEAAPADLVRMLRNGVRMTDALVRAEEPIAPEPGPEPAAIAPAKPVKSVHQSTPRPRKTTSRTAPDEDLTTELRAVQLLDADPELRRPRMGAELARRLGVSESYGGKLHRRLTAEVPPSEPGQDGSGERSGIMHED